MNKTSICSILGAMTVGSIGAVCYGLADLKKGQLVEGASFGGVLGIIVGGIVGAIVGNTPKRMASRLLLTTILGAIPPGIFFAAVYGCINFRSRPGGRTPEELTRDIIFGAVVGIALGGFAAAGVFTLVRLCIDDRRSSEKDASRN